MKHKHILLLAFVLFIGTQSYAYKKTFTSGVKNLPSSAPSDSVQDEKYLTYATTTWMNSFYNRTTLGKAQIWIDRSNLIFVPDKCNIEVIAEITVYKYIPGLPGIDSSQKVTQSFDLYYDTAAGAKEIDKVTRTYPGAVKLRIKITAVNITNSILGVTYPNSTLPNLQMELTVDVERYESLANKYAEPISITRKTYSTTGKKLPYYDFIWDPIIGAETYEVSYKFIETIQGQSPDLSLVGLNYLDFKHDANIVEVRNANNLEIPDIFPDGILICRVRAKGVDITDLDKTCYSPWSVPDFLKLDVLGANIFMPYSGAAMGLFAIQTLNIDADKNWYYSVQFTEGAQTHNSLGYYDGLMRERQALVYQNSNNTVMVSQAIFDYFGRQAVQVMPAPALDLLGFEHRNVFNRDISNSEYEYTDFDLNYSSTDEIQVKAMTENFGANLYFSSYGQSFIQGMSDLSNSEKMMHRYIPKADGYAFAQTEFTRDATGRAIRIGQVGKTHQLDAYNSTGQWETGHAVQVFDGTPMQAELDVLFGNEIGDYQYYKKVMTKDPNGQISIAYIDLSGNTIATALAGGVPTNLDALPTSGQGMQFTAPILNTTVDANSLLKEVAHHILVSEIDTWTFDYELDRLALSTDCDSLCLQCAYDLTMSIKDVATGRNDTQWPSYAVLRIDRYL